MNFKMKKWKSGENAVLGAEIEENSANTFKRNHDVALLFY